MVRNAHVLLMHLSGWRRGCSPRPRMAGVESLTRAIRHTLAAAAVCHGGRTSGDLAQQLVMGKVHSLTSLEWNAVQILCMPRLSKSVSRQAIPLSLVSTGTHKIPCNGASAVDSSHALQSTKYRWQSRADIAAHRAAPFNGRLRQIGWHGSPTVASSPRSTSASVPAHNRTASLPGRMASYGHAKTASAGSRVEAIESSPMALTGHESKVVRSRIAATPVSRAVGGNSFLPAGDHRRRRR